MKEFNTTISRYSFGRASITHNSTANIVHLTIENDQGEPFEIALEWNQMDDLINLCEGISKIAPTD